MKRSRRYFLSALFGGVLAIVMLGLLGRPLWQPVYVKLTGGRTVDQAIQQIGAEAESRLQQRYRQAGVAYPPTDITLIGLKEEKLLELWARGEDDRWRLIHRYPVLAASGTAGPKLREGDKQVPEGVYAIESLNPNSNYHLSMKLDYPNAHDQQRAIEDGREHPGTNIFIHGKAVSVGCLAIGDPAIEELFLHVHRVGIEQTKVILLPHHPRARPLQADTTTPAWTQGLYDELEIAIQPFISVVRTTTHQ